MTAGKTWCAAGCTGTSGWGRLGGTTCPRVVVHPKIGCPLPWWTRQRANRRAAQATPGRLEWGRRTRFLAWRFPLRLWGASVRRYRHQMGWRWARPRWAPARKRDPEAVGKRAAIQTAREAVARRLGHWL